MHQCFRWQTQSLSAHSPPTTGPSGELSKQSILCPKVSLDLKTEFILCSLCLLLEGHVGDDPSQAGDQMLWQVPKGEPGGFLCIRHLLD